MPNRPIVPPATIGMLGGGQLGRYALIAAKVMGYRTIVVDPSADAPAGAVADRHLVAAYDDPDAIAELGRECDVVTTEFENPPAAALAKLAEHTIVAPNANAVATAQDRIAEKTFFEQAGLRCGPWAPIRTADDLDTATAIGFPAVLKTARLGYDGKGQRRVADRDELDAAWADLGSVPCVVERLLPLDVEVSAIVARTADGATAAYPVVENRHRDGILDVTLVPADVDGADAASDAALAVAGALDYVGVLAVEFFVVDGDLFVNEMAPRPHNSGHWTLDVSVTSQFEQQIRAICGLELGSTSMTARHAAMANLLGDEWADGEPAWSSAITASSSLHLYGKADARPGRKMGHLTLRGDVPVGDAVVELRRSL